MRVIILLFVLALTGCMDLEGSNPIPAEGPVKCSTLDRASISDPWVKDELSSAFTVGSLEEPWMATCWDGETYASLVYRAGQGLRYNGMTGEEL